MEVAFSSEDQIYIMFESYRKNNAQKIHVALQEVCGSSTSLMHMSSDGLTILTVKIEVGKFQQDTHIL